MTKTLYVIDMFYVILISNRIYRPVQHYLFICVMKKNCVSL
jgi:hypothetical protein